MVLCSLLVAVLQVEHSILEKDHVSEFIQRISEVIDSQQASTAAVTEGRSVQLCSIPKSEGSGDEVTGNVGMMSGINTSPPSTSNSLKELMPAVGCEVE